MSETRECPHCGKPLPTVAVGGLCPECMLRLGASHPTDWPDETAVGAVGDDRPPPPAPEEMARHFPQLEVLACLGRGGMGVVYQARQPKLNRLVALKVLAPERGTDAKFAERFAQEAQTLARLSHPNIVAVYDFGETNGIYYLLMEYVEGRSLRDLLRAGQITPERALAIVPPICEALQFAHQHGVVHRDIKPENVLLDREGRVKIADFGVAKLLGEPRRHPALTEDRQVIGTPHYMAPEQVERPQLVDHRADIYSLGVVFYEMLTGELPLGRFAPPSRKVGVDVSLDEVVLHALEKEPDRRYQHASEVKTDVEGIAVKSRDAAFESKQRTRSSESEQPLRPAAPLPATRHVTKFKGSRMLGLGAVPPLLWLSVVWMFGVAIWQWVSFPHEPRWIQLLLAAGLLYRFRFAYAAMIFFAVSGLPVALAGSSWHAIAVWVVAALPAVPVAFCTGWFFPRDPTTGRRAGGDFVAGAMMALPALAFLWLLRGGYRMAGIDLDAEVRFWVGAFGLPLSAAAGALLGLALKPWLAGFSCSAAVRSPDQPGRWSAWTLAAMVFLVLSLPLGGGATVMLDLIGQEPSWNPAPAEAVFTMKLGTLTILMVLGTLILGFEALRHMQKEPVNSKGWLGAVAATWLWPFLLISILLTSWRVMEVTTFEFATEQVRLQQQLEQAAGYLEAARGFEPVRDVVLRRTSNLQDSVLDLETGRTVSPPAQLTQSLVASRQLSPEGRVQVLAILDWMRGNGADVVCRDGNAGLTLVDGMGILMSEGREGSPVFERVTAREVLAAAAAMVEPLVLHTNTQPKGLAIFWFDPAEGTNTWAMRTRSGRAGLLELRADRVQPDHIRFRYKLVAENTNPSQERTPQKTSRVSTPR
jgi:tRNA A-37 threonylcarbamoyl transferase component Bud32